jgi:prepilin-type N-terminal cleavage/methylation domain-containing protein
MKNSSDRRLAASQPAGVAKQAGFTLVEIMIVVVILGLLASMAVGTIGRVRERTENTTVFNDLRTFASAFEQYSLELGSWPPDGDAGVVPPAMAGRINEAAWTRGTPGGGRYDWENGGVGIRAGISLFGCNYSDDRLRRIDVLIDDGNLSTGKFRRIHDGRPVYVIEE